MTPLYALVVGIGLGATTHTALWSIPLSAVVLVVHDFVFKPGLFVYSVQPYGDDTPTQYAMQAGIGYLLLVAVGYGIAALVRYFLS